MKVTNFPGGRYWFDPSVKSWVIASVDAQGNQVGDADYVGTKLGRDLSVKARTNKAVILPRKDLPRLIEEVSAKGARPISITIRTEKPLLKKNRVTGEKHKYGDFVLKVSRLSAFLNFDYEKSVNAERKREGKTADFERKGSWLQHSNPAARALVCLPGQPCGYVQLKVEKRLAEEFQDENGHQLQKRWIQNLLPKQSKPNQGVDKPVLTICPKLENIMGLTCEGIEYVVS
jgi:hypothetical protein